jgi:hypothetical protein
MDHTVLPANKFYNGSNDDIMNTTGPVLQPSISRNFFPLPPPFINRNPHTKKTKPFGVSCHNKGILPLTVLKFCEPLYFLPALTF